MKDNISCNVRLVLLFLVTFTGSRLAESSVDPECFDDNGNQIDGTIEMQDPCEFCECENGQKICAVISCPAPPVGCEVTYDPEICCPIIDCPRDPPAERITAEPCPPGSRLMYEGDEYECKPCPRDTFQPEITVNTTQCIPCPPGKGTRDVGAVNPGKCKDICPPGRYGNKGLAPCWLCEINSFQSQERSDECVPCPSGIGTPGIESTACVDRMLILGCQESLFVGPAPPDTIRGPLRFAEHHHAQGHINDLTYDPETRQVYTASTGSGRSQGITQMNLDASEPEHLIFYPRDGPATSIHIDTDGRAIYYSRPRKLHWNSLEDPAAASGHKQLIYASENLPFYRFFQSNGRVLASSPAGGNEIHSYDITGTHCAKYVDPDFEGAADGIIGGAIDKEDEELYWFEIIPGKVVLKRRHVDDIDEGSSVEEVLKEDIDLDVTDMHLWGHWVYFTHANVFGNFTGLARIHKSGDGGIEPVPFNSTGGGCSSLELFDKIMDLQGIRILKSHTVINKIPVKVKRQWMGGLIGEMTIPIPNEIHDWKIKIPFPKQVFKLQIEDCTAEIQRKWRRTIDEDGFGGEPQYGNIFILRPKPDRRHLSAGSMLKLTFVAKTFKGNLGIQRPIFARFTSDVANEEAQRELQPLCESRGSI